jgi:hypothetical protein
MKVKFLVQHIEVEDSLAISCLSLGIFLSGFVSKNEATTKIRNVLQKYLDTAGTEYIKSFMVSTASVNCPEGYVKLPVDLWYCKVSNTLCNLQAQLLINDEASFLSKCSAPPRKKTEILKAVKGGQYQGFHHVPGRYLCPTCKSDGPYKYHYPFELTHMDQLFGVGDKKEFKQLHLEAHRLGLPSSAIACALCPACGLHIVRELDKEIADQLEIIEMDFFPR